ncbi:MAG: HD domain-containing protein [Candidatus Diapherotrites archaeon]|nr:HD domain-containing protein [Candidatus Diapherotrites archaeon]
MQYKEVNANQIKEKAEEYILKSEIKKIDTAIQILEKYTPNAEKQIQHALNTGYILTELKLDSESIASALLHDLLDNTVDLDKKIEEIKNKIGTEVADIVQQVAKIDQIERKNRGKISNKLLTQVVLGTAKDIRTIFIQLAAMLDHLRNYTNLEKSKLPEICKRVQEIHVPIAHKLGAYDIEWELEDLTFKISNPEIYRQIKNELKEKRSFREKLLSEFKEELEKTLKTAHIPATTVCRPKSFSGIYRKMKNQNKKVNELHDLLGSRIICHSVEDCYKILGLLYTKFKSYANEKYFDDYIANPKPNQYKSIHTVIEYKSKPIEVQIRTWDMHRTAEEGLAAHWQYKKFEKEPLFDKQLTWAKQLVEFQRQQKLENLIAPINIGFGKSEIFVLTPNSEIIILPEKSTPVDFAYAIHTDLGDFCEKALVNNKIVTLDHLLENGDIVKIMKSKKAQFKRQWLLFVQSKKARDKIRQKLGLILPAKEKKTQRKITKTTSDKNIQFGKCCNPLQGEEIIGIKTTKRKIIIHRIGCKNIQKLPLTKILEVGWSASTKNMQVKIKITAEDRTSILLDLLNALNKVKVKATEAQSKTRNTIICTFTIEISNPEILESIAQQLTQVNGVKKVERI